MISCNDDSMSFPWRTHEEFMWAKIHGKLADLFHKIWDHSAQHCSLQTKLMIDEEPLNCVQQYDRLINVVCICVYVCMSICMYHHVPGKEAI